MSLSVDIEKKLGAFHLRSQFEAPDETMALLGASGCGKSMTLKCIAGIVTPDRGRIVLGGRVLFDSQKKINLPPQQRRVGYLFQQYALFPNMSVEQNILCGIRSGDKAEKRRVLAEKIRMFRLEGLEKKHPAQLSGGPQQRVALARILCSEPEAILLDEPFSALDSYLKWNLEIELADLLATFNGPILWVSHDRDECYRNCRSVCVMEDGRTGEVTPMDEMIRHPGSVSAARGLQELLRRRGERRQSLPARVERGAAACWHGKYLYDDWHSRQCRHHERERRHELHRLPHDPRRGGEHSPAASGGQRRRRADAAYHCWT